MMTKLVYSTLQLKYSCNPPLLVQLSWPRGFPYSKMIWFPLNTAKFLSILGALLKRHSVQAANELGSDDGSVLKSERAYNNHSRISEFGRSTSLSNSTRADVGRQKRSLKGITLALEDSQIIGIMTLNC